jgi:large subunit ribosomal protein L24
MQKALRRSLLVRNQSLKRERRLDEKKLKDEVRQFWNDKIITGRAQRSNIKAERKHRREDWVLGPLAPNRLAGHDAGSYGMLDRRSLRHPVIPERSREKYFNFAINDRAVIVKGREKGKIGRIREIDEKNSTVILADINMVRSSE